MNKHIVIISVLMGAPIVIGGSMLFMASLKPPEFKPNITAEQFGDEWPLTVDEAQLGCQPPNGVFVQIEGSELTYAVNGAADAMNFSDITPIWANHSDPLIPKKNLDPLIDLGLKLCK